MPVNAVIYARYSSAAQRDVSIEQQIDTIKRYAASQGYTIIRTYADRAVTGKTDKREQFQRMIADAQDGQFSVVLVYSLDRFSRKRYDSAVYKHALKQYGVRVESATESISDDPSGILMEAMLEGVAEYYSAQLSRKVSRGMLDNAKKGRSNGATPLGYKTVDGMYTIVQDEASIVREAFRRYADGDCIADIINSFNERNFLTRHKGRFTFSSLDSMLRNRKYVGIYEYAGIVSDIPSIVEEELFNAVQERLRDKQRRSERPQQRLQRDETRYILTGKAFCGHCQQPMVGVSGTSRNGEKHGYYVCKTHRSHGACDKKSVPKQYAENLVLQAIMSAAFTDEMIDWMADQSINAQLAQAQDTRLLNDLRARLADAQICAQNLMSAIQHGSTGQAFIERYNAKDREIQGLKQQIEEQEERAEKIIPKQVVVSVIRAFRDETIRDDDFCETIIRAFCEKVYFYDNDNGDGIHIQIWLNLKGKPQLNVDATMPIDFAELRSDSVKLCSYNSKFCPPFRIIRTSVYVNGLFGVIDVWS